MPKFLQNKKGILLGVANEDSLAWGCAKAFHRQGAELAFTYLNEKAKPYVEPLANEVEAPILMPLDVTNDEQWDAFFAQIEKEWGKIDFAVHSIAFAPKEDLHGRVVDCSAKGFSIAMDVSCHSFIRMAKACEPLMKDGGSLITMSYFGAQRVVNNYNMMGPVKAALEAAVRQLAFELGDKLIRVNAVSSGPVKTRAASGLQDFDDLMAEAIKKAPIQEITTIEHVGAMAAYLVSDVAQQVTGQSLFVDGGVHIMGM